jgi:hypothetical protein
MKLYLHNFFHDLDLSPFYNLFKNVFNEKIEPGTIENSDILFESVFGNNSLLYDKKWLYSFLFIGESDRRLCLFIKNGLNNPRLKDYSCVLKGKSENDYKFTNVVNFPLYTFYSYSFDFTYKFKKEFCHENRWVAVNNTSNKYKPANIPTKNVCVIISNGNDSEGRNYFLEQLEKYVKIDYAGNYKNNVERVQYPHCSPEFIDFVSKYKVIISMENSKNDNYITEKILHGFIANTIPVYWGANNIVDYFNEERFINVNTFNDHDIHEAIDKIMMVLNNDDKFLEMMNKPIYKDGRVPLTLNNISDNIKTLLNIEKTQYKKFITFGNQSYYNAVNRICDEANSLHFFDDIKGYKDTDLKNDKPFWNQHGKFIETNGRGYGCWLWKSYLMKQELDKLNYNDILIYCDAGCHINNNGKNRLMEYIDLLNSNKDDYGLISFQLEFYEYQYTKSSIFEKLQCDEYYKNRLQCLGGILIIKKNEHSIHIINEWYKYCEDYDLINDKHQVENSLFIDNRHDQSILSVLVNKYGSIKLKDETYFAPNWQIDGFHYPFWATRNKN